MWWGRGISGLGSRYDLGVELGIGLMGGLTNLVGIIHINCNIRIDLVQHMHTHIDIYLHENRSE